MTRAHGRFELWSKSTWANVDVVGESHYKREIRSLLPDPLGSNAEVMVDAGLVPEPRNRHDRNAVRVVADGQHVGYLARDVAAQYSPLFQTLTARGMIPTTRCRVYGYETGDIELDWRGRSKRTRDFVGSVSVVLDAPHLCVPANLPPPVPHRVLPRGNALQLKDEEKHLDMLAPWVSRHGEAAVYATLHAVAPASGRSSKRIVEVRIDDEAIGRLTPAMSDHYLAIIDRLDAADHVAAARVYLKGNSLKVEATLHAERSHQLAAEWLASLPTAGTRPKGASDAPEPAVASPTAPVPASPDGLASGTRTIAEMTPAFRLPAKPSRIVFRAPHDWPEPPQGWEPPAGWTPPGDWPAPPDGWVFWEAETTSRG